ncbi:hypothetical protein BDZ89DRAFT_1163048 [Hymenopellis radicata]|nr:hypothetical protein BDZ89DRAFT_1163048 [Hymenopellis radicata]
MSTAQPVSLNDDVVRLLLERTVELHRPSALNLLLLSKWVRSFVEPVLYHTVVLDQLRTLELFATTMDMRPDLGKHVRRLRIGDLRSSFFGPPVMTGIPLPIDETWDTVRAVLVICVNVNQFAFWVEECNPGLASLFRCQCGGELLQLTRLSLQNVYQPSHLIKTRTGSLTHLHLDFFLHFEISGVRWSDVFERCRGLTHVLVTSSSEGFPRSIAYGDVEAFAQVMNPIIAILPAAIRQFVVVLNPLPDTAPEMIIQCLSLLHKDKRFVVVSTKNTFLGRVNGLRCYPDTHDIASDWGYGGGIGVWELAEGM